MKISYLKYFYILLIVFILSMLGSFAYFSWGSDASSNTNVSFDVVAETVYIEYDAGSDIEGANLYPTDDKSDGISKDITVKTDKVSSKSVTFNLYLDLTDVSEELMDDSFKWAIYRDNQLVASDSITKNIVGCSKNNTNHIVLVNNETVNTTLKKYTLYLWIDGNMTNPDTMMNKSFKVKLHADGNNALINDLYHNLKTEAVADNKTSTYVSSSSGIKFSSISSDTNGKGLYMKNGTASDPYPIYYYRGAVDNNNVIFANFCWKIVRTTETGGTKLVYSGTPNNGTCNNTGDDVVISSTAFNTNFISPTYVGYKYGTVYNHASKTLSDSDLYGTDVTYTNGTYTLTSTQTGYSQGLSTHHYTCFNSTGTCTKVYYIFCVESTKGYYITLASGKKASEALSEMLDNNTTDSTIKTAIDNWYSTNMTSYTNKLEDTVWCNDRSIYITGGWNPNGGSTSGGWTSYSLVFSRYKNLQNASPDLTCSRNLDKFTTSTENGNGELTYPVGLLTVDEIMLAGGKDYISNTSYYLYTGTEYWTLTSRAFISDGSREYYISADGTIGHSYVRSVLGVRPTISLKPGNIISSGDGTAANPYVIS